MKLFGKELNSKKLSVLDKLSNIDEKVNDMSRDILKNSDKSVQMIYMSGESSTSEKKGSGRALAVVGSSEDLVNMLFYAGKKDANFAKMIIYASELLTKEDKNLKEEDDTICNCLDCQLERMSNSNGKKSIENMTESEMDDIVKNVINAAKRRK